MLVAVIAAVLYWPSLWADFVNLDDPQYVTGNPYIILPSWKKLWLFFAEATYPTTVAGYYQPLTMASLMLDRVIDGTVPPRPFVYHLTNVLIHAANAGLAFAWLRSLMRWMAAPNPKSEIDNRQSAIGGISTCLLPALAALLFAVHPVNVEVVSWVCQRKAVLSTLFALAALLTYNRFVLRRGGSGAFAAYAWTCVFFTLSLLAKPTGWLLPLVLLVLDFWPLGRLNNAADAARRAIEKIPLFVIAAVGGWIAYVSQHSSMGRAKVLLVESPIEGFLILMHNVRHYLKLLLWPAMLSPQYPMPLPAAINLSNPAFVWGIAWTLAVAAILLLAVFRKWRALLACLIGYFILLLPVMGGVNFMGTIAADRFLYLPMLLLLPLIVLAGSRLKARGSWLLLLPLIGMLALKTWSQQSAWQDSFAYWHQAQKYDPVEADIWDGLASAHLARFEVDRDKQPAVAADHLDKAEQFSREAIRKRPTHTRAYFTLSQVLVQKGRYAEALAIAQDGWSIPEADNEGYLAQGRALSRLGRYAEAIPLYEQYLRGRPTDRESLRNLGNALCAVGRWSDAETYYLRLIEVDPADGEAFYGLGRVRYELGGDAAAIAPLEAARDRKPRDGQLRLALAARYASVNRDDDARRELMLAIRLKPDLLTVAEQSSRFGRFRNTPFWTQLHASASRPADAPAPGNRNSDIENRK